MIPMQFIIQAFSKGTDLTSSFLSKADTEKFVKDVNELMGPERVYSELDTQEEIIRNSTELSDPEKIELLRAITAQKEGIRNKEIERKQESAAIIDNHLQKVAEIGIKLGLAFLTAGWSLAPDIYNGVKSMHHPSKTRSVIDNTLLD